MHLGQNNSVTDRLDQAVIEELAHKFNNLFNSQEGLIQNLLKSLFVTDDIQLAARSKFEEFMNNKINNEAERIKFLGISNKLIEDKKITIGDIIHTIELIEQHWYNYETNVFFYCLFIEKFLKEKEMDLNSLESLLNNPEFKTKLLPVNTADASKDIRSAISLLRMCGVFNYRNQPGEECNFYF